jgi:hypothetical protein
MTLESIALETLANWAWSNYAHDVIEGILLSTRYMIKDKEKMDRALDSLRDLWAKVKWDEAAQKYHKRIKDQYSTMRVLGNPKPISLENIFSEVYVFDKLTAQQRFDIEQLQRKATVPGTLPPPGNRKNALRVAIEKEFLFVLGKPGAGKTTFLKYLSLKAAEGKLRKVPIFVALKEWSDIDTDLMSFITSQFDICGFPDAKPFIEYLLNKGMALVLLDGLDEVNQEQNKRSRTTTDLIRFFSKYPKSQYIITCRTAATDYMFDRFTYVELADFDDKQIRTFVNNWFKEDKSKENGFIGEFEKEDNAGLRELARTPLLLTLLCLAFEESMTFPQRRVELYEEALDALLKRWDASRNIRRDEIYRKLSLGRKRQLFARIAAETFEKGTYFFRQRELANEIVRFLQKVPPVDEDEDIDGDAILKAIESQHGLIIERAYKIYSFSHLTFQEYYTARYIVDNASDGTLERLIKYHTADNRWHEVFLLTVSMLSNADSFFDTLQNLINVWAGAEEKLADLIRQVGKENLEGNNKIRNSARATDLAIKLALSSNRARLHARLAVHHLLSFLSESRSYNLDRDRSTTLEHVHNIASYTSRAQKLIRASSVAYSIAVIYDPNIDVYHDLLRQLVVDYSSVLEQINWDTTEMIRNLNQRRKTESSFTIAQVGGIAGRLDPLLREAGKTCDNLLYTLGMDFAPIRNKVHNKKVNEPVPQIFTSDSEKTPISNWEDVSSANAIDFTEEEVDVIWQYLEANRLLMDCLPIAYVSNRAKYENQLLRLFDR